MNIKFWNQPKFKNLGDVLNERLSEGFDNIYLISGVAKDDGFDVIFDNIKKARELGSNISIAIGLDRKSTSKDMLLKLLNLGCNVSAHINSEESKVETRAYVFEKNNIGAIIYVSSGKFSEGGLLENNCLIQEITYSLEDKKAFDNFKATLLQGVEEVFKPLTEEDIKLLAEKGEILARIIDRKIPGISELYGNTITSKPTVETTNNDIYDETTQNKLFEIPENNIDIDIDIDMEGTIKKRELSVEYEARIEKEEKDNLNKLAEEKLAKFYDTGAEEIEDKKVSIIKDSAELDYENMNILVFELNKIIETGAGEGEIKLPLYLYENMTKFFGHRKNFIMLKDGDKERLGNQMHLSIVDVKDGKNFEDNSAICFDAGKYFAIKSNILKDLQPDEDDIIRFIKKDENTFDVELIRKGAKEFEIWESFCKFAMKNSKRRYGIM